MTIKLLKEMIADLPDDARIYADDSKYDLFGDDASEFVCMATNDKMVILQTKDDIDVEEELRGTAEVAIEFGWGDEEFYMELLERGYTFEDFPDPEIAKAQMEEHGLI